MFSGVVVTSCSRYLLIRWPLTCRPGPLGSFNRLVSNKKLEIPIMENGHHIMMQ